MDGRANIVERRVSGAGGQIDGLYVRLYLIHRQGPDRAQFEQAYSDHGGTSSETNWIAVDQRIRHGS